MLFNSIEFFIFFPIVTALYFLLPHKFRWFHLLVSSCIFYMSYVPIYITILFATIIIDYVAGIMIERAEGPHKKWFLVLSVVANLGILGVFKYYNFFISNVNDLLHISSANVQIPLLGIILPIGLSFHTFQAMSYTIEVYRGKQKAEKHFGIYALYVMFYPQLVAGPIERPQNVLHQFHEKHAFNYDEAVAGSRQILQGLIKKVVIADRLSLITDPIFNYPQQASGTTSLIGCWLFAFQIFCDFSGYSDIALGAARMMGFKLMVNFKTPFESKSISEFWRRWHISLSTWFNDYLFNPLASSWRNFGNVSIVLALVLTFFLSGIWHGAGWKFAIYGLLHGIAVSYEFLTKKKRKKLFALLPQWLNNTVSVFITFNYVAFSWIFFRANNVKDAFYMLGKIAHVPAELITVVKSHKIAALNPPSIILLGQCLLCIIALELFHKISASYKLDETFKSRPFIFRWSIYAAGLASLYFFGVFENHTFIYFQF